MLGNPENERKCIFQLKTKPEVKKEAVNQIRYENIDLIKFINKLERILPQMKINYKKKIFLFCGEMQQYILEVRRSEHITDATKLAQKIYRSELGNRIQKLAGFT